MPLPSEDTFRFLVTRYAQLRAAHGEALASARLVLPNGEFFPDAFSKTPEGVETLMKRTMTYAPLAEDIDLEMAFLEPSQSEGGGGCSSGACGPDGTSDNAVLGHATELEEGGYRVHVRVTDVGNPTLLTASLARNTGSILLAEAEEEISEDIGIDSEIAAMATGLGLLLVNGACVYVKSCGGLRAHQGTYLSIEESCLALGLFLRVHGIKPSLARGQMETTQREAFDEVMPWIDSNEAILAALRTHPETLADGVFKIEEERGFLSRIFGKKAEIAPPTTMAVKARVRTEAELRRIAETKALVEEALKT